MKTFRLLRDGFEDWRGKARDFEEAEEKAFFHDCPRELERYTLQVWTGKKWRTIYRDACLSD